MQQIRGVHIVLGVDAEFCETVVSACELREEWFASHSDKEVGDRLDAIATIWTRSDVDTIGSTLELRRRLAGEDEPDAIDINQRANGDIEFERANVENTEKELISYQDGKQTGELVSTSLRQVDAQEPTLDRVEVVKIGNVFRGISCDNDRFSNFRQ